MHNGIDPMPRTLRADRYILPHAGQAGKMALLVGPPLLCSFSIMQKHPGHAVPFVKRSVEHLSPSRVLFSKFVAPDPILQHTGCSRLADGDAPRHRPQARPMLVLPASRWLKNIYDTGRIGTATIVEVD